MPTPLWGTGFPSTGSGTGTYSTTGFKMPAGSKPLVQQPVPVSMPSGSRALDTSAINWGDPAPAGPVVTPWNQPAQPAQPPGPQYTSVPVSMPAGSKPLVQHPYPTEQPGVLSKPGAYEEWYKQNAGKYGQPSQLAGYQQGVQDRYGTPGVQPAYSSQAYRQVQDKFEAPSYGVDWARDVSAKLNRASPGESMMSQAAGYFQGPNMTSNYAGSLDGGMFSKPGQAEQYNQYGQTQLRSQGAGERNVYSTLGQYQGPGAAETNNTTVQNLMGGNNASRTFNDGLTSGGFTGKNTVGDELDFFRPQLRQNSYSEDLYESGNKGLNTFYDREQEKRSKRLSDQMAAMGVFGSGATARGMYELEGELGAAQARDMASLAAQADQARLGRAASAESFATAAGGEEIARHGLGMEAAYKSDESTRGNADRLTTAANNAQTQQLRRMFEGGQLGLQADAEGRARLDLGGRLSKEADASAMNRARAGADIYNMADSSRFAQGEGLANTGKQLSDTYLQRYRDSTTAGLAADQEERLRVNDMFARGKELDASVLDSERFNRDTAGGIDKQDLERLQAGGDAAEAAQRMFETRERYPIQDKQKLAEAMSGLVASAAGKSADEQAAIQAQIIQSLVTEGGLSYIAAQQKAQEMFQAMGIGIQGVGAAANAQKAAPPAAAPKPAAPVAQHPGDVKK